MNLITEPSITPAKKKETKRHCWSVLAAKLVSRRHRYPLGVGLRSQFNRANAEESAETTDTSPSERKVKVSQVVDQVSDQEIQVLDPATVFIAFHSFEDHLVDFPEEDVDPTAGKPKGFRTLIQQRTAQPSLTLSRCEFSSWAQPRLLQCGHTTGLGPGRLGPRWKFARA